jgi:hypothetical protein
MNASNSKIEFIPIELVDSVHFSQGIRVGGKPLVRNSLVTFLWILRAREQTRRQISRVRLPAKLIRKLWTEWGFRREDRPHKPH